LKVRLVRLESKVFQAIQDLLDPLGQKEIRVKRGRTVKKETLVQQAQLAQ